MRDFSAAFVRFSNRPSGSSTFQAIHHSSVDVAHGLALLFGLGTKALPSWDSTMRWNIYRALNQLRPSGQSTWRPTPSLSQVCGRKSFVIESFRSGVRRRGLNSPVAIGDTALSPKAVGSAPSTTGDHARASASKERRQKTANSHPAMAGGQRREDARSDPWRRRGRRQDHGADAPAGNA